LAKATPGTLRETVIDRAMDGIVAEHTDHDSPANGKLNGTDGYDGDNRGEAVAAVLDTTGRQVVVGMEDNGEPDSTAMSRVSEEYTADTMRLLEGVEHVRTRPAMYIGDTGSTGLHHLMYEVVDNSIDEVLAGHASEIWVTVNPDNTLSVRDNGRGIPADVNKQTGLSGVELAMTKLNAGGKFGGGGYKVSGGLHGVGLSCVNFLSEWCEAIVEQNGKMYKLRCERGIPKPKGKGALKEIGASDRTGTTITWLADKEIFGDYVYKPDVFESRIRNTCYLNREVTIHYDDKLTANAEPKTYHYKRGIAELVDHLNENKDGIGEAIYFMKTRDDVQVEIALQYNQTYSETVLSFANNVHTKEGGTHLSGFRTALTRVINQYARKSGALKEKDVNLSGDDVREGLTAVISVRLFKPQFEGQTKAKLGNSEVEGIVNSIMGEGLTQFLEENPQVGKRIVDKALTAQRARDAARKAADLIKRQSSLENSNLPGKLADCTERDPKKCELFLVEGDSAGGCFSGDTRLVLADGRHLSFQDLVAEQADGKEHFGYTIRHNGQVGLERLINARVTKQNAPVIRVTLDNDETITCTPDHRFLLRDGTYKPAAQLTADDALMPLYRKVSDTQEAGITIDGYEMVWDPRSDRWLFTHTLAEADRDNSCRQPAEQTYYRKSIAALRQCASANGAVNVDAYAAHRAQTGDKSLLRFDRFCGRYFGGDQTRACEAVAHYNHRIVSVETLNECMDVYDVEVPGTHNFALASGVFVHNSAKQGRDRRYQAILPLRGKIINVGKAALDKTLENNEVRSLITALGIGIKVDSMDDADAGESSSKFDLSRLRYDRIIIMTDADVDGDHIRTLLLTFFFQYMQPLLEGGHVYIAQPPLFSIKAGKDIRQYARSYEERDRIVKDIKRKDIQVGRFKGLGEMDASDLYDTTMNIETRTIARVSLDDAEKAAEMFSILMSEKVEPRKAFIIRYAKEVQNVDWHC